MNSTQWEQIAKFPELFEEDEEIDRRQCKRVVPMRVLVLGMPRTGTASTKKALEILGYGPVYHMTSAFSNPKDCDMWNEAFDAKFFGKGNPFRRRDWDQLLGHCQAVTDMPAAAFGPELIAAYPDAKIVLTNRNIDSWHKSIMSTVAKAAGHPMLSVLAFVDKSFFAKWVPMIGKMTDGYFGGDYGLHGKKVFAMHYEEIRRAAPANRLLEWKVCEGWDNLCKFLECPIPEEQFPNINETADFHERLSLLRRQRISKSVRAWIRVEVLSTIFCGAMTIVGSIYVVYLLLCFILRSVSRYSEGEN